MLKLPVTYSQNDGRWKGTTLGTKGTIGAYGCLMTCATMVANYYGANETPLTVNEKLKNNGGFANGNLFVWSVFAKLFGLKYSGQWSNNTPLTKSQMDQIRKAVDKGYPVFLQIDMVPADSDLDEHWILVIDYDGDDFIIQDPWDGATKRITSWGVLPQKLIYAWCWFEGKVPSQSNETTITIKTQEHGWLVSRATVAKEVAQFLGISDPDNADTQAYRNVVNGFKSRSSDLEKQLAEAKTEQGNREEQVARLKDECQKSEQLRFDLEKQLKLALKNVSEISGVYEGQLKEKQGVINEQGKKIGELNHTIATKDVEIKKLKENATVSLSLYDIGVLLVKKIVPFLKNTKV